jgi:NAD(P)-dependent dehydrogenase (short-subunit alcohol dehydrogenase family)
MTENSILDLFKLTDQVAFITGGGRGIGRAIAVAFAEAGADIVAVSRTADQLAETSKLVQAKGRRCLTVSSDVTDMAQIETSVDKAMTEFGKIDVLVNNAGGVHNYLLLEELTEEEWDKQLNINLKSSFLCSQAIGKVMLKQGRGKIINISSVTSFAPFTGIAPYNAAKSALNNFTKQIAMEWGPKGIWANAIAPGGVDTHAPEQLRASRKKRGMQIVPLKRSNPERPPYEMCVADPAEYAPIALFLASAASNHLTGDIISPGSVALKRS